MAEQIPGDSFSDRLASNRLLPVMLFWGLAVVVLIVFLWFEVELADGFGEYYLLPWSLLAGIVILTPTAFILYRGKLDLFHPLVFGVWSYIFPSFVLGGFILAFNLNDPYFLTFVENPRYEIPLSLFYVTVGYLSVVAGFYLPINRYFVRRIDNLFPDWNWAPDRVWLSGLVLMAIGIGFNIIGLIQGVFGFQRIDQIGIFDSLFFYLATFYLVGNLMLWIVVFQVKEKSGVYYGMLALLCVMIPVKMAIAGNRGSLMSSVLPIALAFWYSGRRLKWQHSVAFGVVLSLAIGIGIIYGTAFRNIKGSEARVSAGDYVGQIGETLDYLSRRDLSKLLVENSQSFFERIENLSSLAVVVSNYEKLEQYESSYGLKNNIRNDLMTAFVPRFVWPDKPNTSDPRLYSDLYFSNGENSFAITPFGDLLRNFGFWGIVAGMMIIGIYFRVIFSVLIENDKPRIWKKMSYYPLLTVVSYESFYAIIAPNLIRTLVILVLCVAIVVFLTPNRDQST